MTNEHRRAFLLATSDFWYCPTTNAIIFSGSKSDNKVLCGCGVSNPACPREDTRKTATHVKQFLRPATVDAYMAQEQTRGRR